MIESDQERASAEDGENADYYPPLEADAGLAHEPVDDLRGSIGPYSTHLGEMGAEALARQLLNELIDGAEPRAKTS